MSNHCVLSILISKETTYLLNANILYIMYTSSDILQLKPVYAYGQLILCMCIDTQNAPLIDKTNVYNPSHEADVVLFGLAAKQQ